MTTAGVEALANESIFSGLSQRHLRRILKATEEYSYPDGATVVAEGTPSEGFFAILDGRAKIVRRHRTIRRLHAGDVFGEIALLDGGPRTASVVADGPLRCLILLRKEFRRVLTQEPQVAYRVLVGTASLLRNVDKSGTG